MQFESTINEMDFASMLEASFAEEAPERGDIVTGIVVAIDQQGLIVGIEGMKRDGVVERRDLERSNVDIDAFTVGQEVDVMIVRMEDEDGNLLLSISQAAQTEDWKRAEELMNNDEVWEGVVSDANRGGLIVPFGNLRGFVPASHVIDLPRGLNEDERRARMMRLIGQPINMKVIEVNRKRRRLVFSQRDAQRGSRDARKEVLLDQLKEGEVRKGVVSGLRDFGAFVDLGGADGLIHISELAWHRVNHPREVLNVGDEVEVYILRLDAEGKRIGLSLKRLQENPWARVEEMYHVGQLVEGTVSRVTQFGAFISLDPGIEALLHTSQLADPPPADPSLVVHEGQRLMLRVISIEADKQRLGLSLKEVSSEERARWDATQETPAGESSESVAEAEVEAPAEEVSEAVAEMPAEEASPAVAEAVAEASAEAPADGAEIPA
ncbi:MAG: S1 RNA-binding domain-containing protein [Chloroflexi bacterium]|nr:S1 RNA-binding domain-containing protein [Chloroflexota bacterium]